jgi:hypothetical protein
MEEERMTSTPDSAPPQGELTELRPCPICEGPARVSKSERVGDDGRANAEYGIECVKHGCMNMFGYTHRRDALPAAIERWNHDRWIILRDRAVELLEERRENMDEITDLWREKNARNAELSQLRADLARVRAELEQARATVATLTSALQGERDIREGRTIPFDTLKAAARSAQAAKGEG